MAKEESPEFKELVQENRWHNRAELEQALAVIQRLSTPPTWTEDGKDYAPGSNRWSWARNQRCKYVDLRIDMRDGGWILLDNGSRRISLEQLTWQHGEDDNAT